MPAYDEGTSVDSREEKDWLDAIDDDTEEASLQGMDSDMANSAFLRSLFPSGQIRVEVRSRLQLRRCKSGIERT